MSVFISIFEIYGWRVFDLLNDKNLLNLLEDKNQKIQVQGLVERQAMSESELLNYIQLGHNVRTTHATTSNDTSSRSHAICQLVIKDNYTGKVVGKMSIVDLAGSERAQDCQSNNRQRRLEGAEINKSLLALKECIRALDTKSVHVPFRASKLTMILRDSFISSKDKTRIVMIACVSPGKSSAEHTINTCRYAIRLKEKTAALYDNNTPLEENNEDQIPMNLDYAQIPQPQSKIPLKKNISSNNDNRIEYHNNQKENQAEDEYITEPMKDSEDNKENIDEKSLKSKNELVKREDDWQYLKKTINGTEKYE